MRRWVLARLLFWCATLVALLVFALTVPDGLPWNASSHLACLVQTRDAAASTLPFPIWRHFVETFAGNHVALSCVAAAVAAGFATVLTFGFCGWRVAVGVALVWTFAPAVWNRAILGERSVCVVSSCLFGLWALMVIARRVFCRACLAWHSDLIAEEEYTVLLVSALGEKGQKLCRRVSWGILGAACVFAIVSLAVHDYQLGEAASAYARGVVEEASGRLIVMNGVADDQVNRAACLKSSETISLLDQSPAARTRLIRLAAERFPRETNLWLAAHVSAGAFVEAALKAHPDRLYIMDGRSATHEGWKRRWKAFATYLKSSDPFVSVARRAFAVEGNRIANAFGDGRNKEAYAFYRRLFDEVDPGNISALANMSELVRRGYDISGDERRRLQTAFDRFFKDAYRREHVREIALACGPIRDDPELLAKLESEARRRLAERVASGTEPDASPARLSLVEWSNAMVVALDSGEMEKAARLARKILSNEKWRGYVPANAVLGAVTSAEGDYAASEAFFCRATNTTERIPAATLNDFADTLLNTGRAAEAEAMARRAVAEGGPKYWLSRLTLAETLVAQKKDTKELHELCREVVRQAPTNVRERVRVKVERLRREVAR